MALTWIKHKNKDILYIDYSHFQLEEILPQMRKAAEICVNSDDRVLLLANFTDVGLGRSNERKKLLDECLSMGKNIFEPNTEKSAIIGISGIKKMFYSMYIRFTNHSMKLFNSKEEALDYLVLADRASHEINRKEDLVL